MESGALPAFLPTDVALPYGLGADGRLVAIGEVARGKACDCVCPGCRRPLVARKALKIRHHFAHAANAVCAGGFESMLHLLAKELIEKHRSIVVPEAAVSVGETHRHISPARTLPLSNIRLEQWIGGLRPDIVADFDGHDLIIEIAVTHKAEETKLEELRRRGAPAIEIDLSAFHHREVTEPEIWHAIHSGATRYWLFNRLMELERADAAKAEDIRLRRELTRELAMAKEHATLVEEWARWEETEGLRLLEVARAKKAAEDAKDRAIGRAKEIVFQVGLSHFRDEKVAREWVERCAVNFSVLGGFSGATPDLSRFTTWCAGQIRDEEQRQVELRAAAKLAREALLRVAIMKFGATDLADLWMNTTNPKIGRRRPADVVLEPNGIQLCKMALG
jgi:hypothetical protein